MQYYRDKPQFAVSVLLTQAMEPGRQHALLQWAQALARTIPQDAPASPALWYRAEAIHDRLCAMLAYDHTLAQPDVHNAYGALMNGLAVCEGYVKAMTLLCRLNGIPCSILLNDAANDESHSWNLLEVEPDRFIQVDVTWDDQELLTHACFGLEAVGAHTVDWSNPLLSALPRRIDDTLCWHAVKGCLAAPGQVRQVLDPLLHRLVTEGVPAELRFADPDDYAQALADLNRLIMAYNAQAPQGEQLYGAYSIRPVDEQRCLIITLAD